ncbi:Sen15 protein-domain-containing protein [Paraphoma chrysanthemicola]|uniref:Sen15 protein-domain-containing protein n=1 Tax=Paraphoma chrysanthemicola TaxID=798071 RepID=A0A8K0RCE7_9PLEO|nr:Sen15 protein-domain-containing protein [Paraphoma chrysanthemicola]
MTSLATTKPAIVPAPLQQAFASLDSIPFDASHLPQLQSLAVQIQHNLEFQHYWTQLHVHTHSPVTNAPLPRPLVSGLPPQRLYVHPDEQVELLKEADRKRKANKAGEEGGLQVKPEPEREWVLPTRLNEKWTLRRLAEVFDAITHIPPAPESDPTTSDRPENPWRTTKRVVLGTVDSDSTVVYYIVHDGVVKPRQN